MKKRLFSIILIAVFLIGFSLLAYPTVSNYINSLHQSRAIAGYEEGISELDTEDFSAYRQAADAYNQKLADDPNRFNFTDGEKAEYQNLLDPLGNGIMGYIEIRSIDVELPIYHGSDDDVLEVGAGHLEGTSLPVGGESTHCALSGHRGLPSAKLFTDLDQMQIGDIFLIHVLDQVLAYQVDKISIVEPGDTKELAIVDGMDYCTLVTCTPYGVNTQRLLVRGVRVDYSEAMSGSSQVTADAVKVDPTLVAPVLAIPVLLALLIWLLVSTHAKKSKIKQRKGNKSDQTLE